MTSLDGVVLELRRELATLKARVATLEAQWTDAVRRPRPRTYSAPVWLRPRVLAHLAEHDGATASEMATALGRTVNNVIDCLQKAELVGLVRRSGERGRGQHRPGWRWHLTPRP